MMPVEGNSFAMSIYQRLSHFFLALLFFVCAFDFGHAAVLCEDLINSKSARRRAAFVSALQTEDLRKAGAILSQEKKRVAAEIDALSSDQKKILERQWAGINSGSIISTPLSMLVNASAELNFKPGQIFADIGSGHGDPALVFGSLNPGLEVTGYDFVKAKVDSAQRLAQSMGLRNVEFIQQDLSDPNFRVRVADYYYFFNPTGPEIVRKVVREIKENSRIRPAKIVTLKGGWTDGIIKEEGFVQVRGLANGRMAVYKMGSESGIDRRNIKNLIQLAEENLVRLQSDLADLERSSRHRNIKNSRARELKNRSEKVQKEIFKRLNEMQFKETWSYLQSLSREEIRLQTRYLDALFGFNDGVLSSFANWQLRDVIEEHPTLRGLWYSDKISEDQTSWETLLSIVESMRLKPGDQVVDVGAGFGRLGVLIGLLHPGVSYIGYEVNGELSGNFQNIVQGRGLTNLTMIQENIQTEDWHIPEGTTHIVFLNSLARGFHSGVYNEIFRYISRQGSPKPMYIRQ